MEDCLYLAEPDSTGLKRQQSEEKQAFSPFSKYLKQGLLTLAKQFLCWIKKEGAGGKIAEYAAAQKTLRLSPACIIYFSVH